MKLRITKSACLCLLGLSGSVIATLLDGDGMEDHLRCLRELFIMASAASLHEIGHVLAAWGGGTPLRSLRLDLFGARLTLGGLLSYRREWIIAAAGPFVNLLSAALVLPLCMRCMPSSPVGEGLRLFFTVSLGLAFINLLPVRSLDGGRLLRCTLAPLCGERLADGMLTATTALFLGALWLLSVYALLRLGEMLSLFVFSLCLLLRVLCPDQTG